MCSFLHHKTPTSNPHQYQIDDSSQIPPWHGVRRALLILRILYASVHALH